MLIGKINAKTRQKILVTIQDIKKVKMIDVRVYHTSEDGRVLAGKIGERENTLIGHSLFVAGRGKDRWRQ